MDNLSVWHDGENYVVAASAEDATAICVAEFGEYGCPVEWRKLPDNHLVRKDPIDEFSETAECKYWVKENGRGYLFGWG